MCNQHCIILKEYIISVKIFIFEQYFVQKYICYEFFPLSDMHTEQVIELLVLKYGFSRTCLKIKEYELSNCRTYFPLV
jgi:hypothetical protein